MTFSLTERCLFCGREREVDGKESWHTLLSIFETRESNGHTHRIKVGAGVVVTVCHECRSRPISDLISEGRKVY